MSTVVDFDPADRARRVAAAASRRETIAEDTARLMEHAAREGWGEAMGLPVLCDNVLVYHFSSGKRGIVHLPQNTNYGDKEA